MLKIIKERDFVTLVCNTIDFYYKDVGDGPDRGFSFPATDDGKPDFASMGPEMRANYEACLTDENLTEAEFVRSERVFAVPALGQCSCGEVVELFAEEGQQVIQCKCGRRYNLAGQEITEFTEED